MKTLYIQKPFSPEIPTIILWIKHSFLEWSLSHSIPLSTLPSSLPQQCRLIIRFITHTRPCGSAKRHSTGAIMLCLVLETSIIFLYVLQRVLRLLYTNNPVQGRNDVPLGLDVLQSVLPTVDEVSDILTSGRDGGGVYPHHCSQGRSKHVPRSHASHRQFYWAGKLTGNIITARTLVPNIPPALSVPDTIPDASASLHCGFSAELYSGIWAFLGFEELKKNTRKRRRVSHQALSLRCQCTGNQLLRTYSGLVDKVHMSSNPRAKIYSCFSIFSKTLSQY